MAKTRSGLGRGLGSLLGGGADGALPQEKASPVERVVVENEKEEPKKYGGLRVKKVDASSGAGLSGAQFTVESADGETFTMESNESGLAELPATALIEGSYTVRETRAPDGYTLNEEWRHQFSIERDGQIVDLTKDPCKNSEIPKVALPVTGATGISTLAIACVVMVAAGTFLRRRGSFVR